jgi:hypothetical protein
MASSTKLSVCGERLPPDSKCHYLQKLELIFGIDAFVVISLAVSTSRADNWGLPFVKAGR